MLKRFQHEWLFTRHMENSMRLYIIVTGMVVVLCAGLIAASTLSAMGDMLENPGLKPYPAQSQGVTCTGEKGRSVPVGSTWCRGGQLHECQKNGQWTNLRTKC